MELELSCEDIQELDCQLAELFLNSVPEKKLFNLYMTIKSKPIIESYEQVIISCLERYLCNQIN